jgi:hypothetical protein
MTFCKQSGQKAEPDTDLGRRLENIGVKEIGIWKEMVLRDDSLFNEVYRLIYCDNPRIAWHAAWVTDHASEACPAKLEAYIPELIEQLPKLKSSSLKRHFTRMLISQKIPADQMGLLVDVLYNLLSPSEAIAVRANALQVLLNIALIEPELQPELIRFTESILEEELTPGMISKARSIIKLLRHQ